MYKDERIKSPRDQLSNIAVWQAYRVGSGFHQFDKHWLYERLGYQLSEDTRLDVGDGRNLDYWKSRKPLFADKS